jgi:mRNA deadenylase 3'-5' endonuclease subunit Ccr4
MDFTVATYNVLATAYIKPAWYPQSPKELLDPRHRIPALVEHLVQLRAESLVLPAVDDHTPLPGPGQPSDHVAVRTRLAWRA